MKYFIDSASPEKISEIMKNFHVDGVTTNPTIISRENTDYLTLLKRLRNIVAEKLLFVQVTAKDTDGMILEAKLIKEKIGGNLCIKIPANAAGLAAIMSLSKQGISTTATAVYSIQQAMLCAAAGADFVAPYMSHIDNMCVDSTEIAGDMATLFSHHFPNTHVLAASFRVAEQINRVIMSGVDAITIAPEMFGTLISNRQTDAELEAFEKNWQAFYGDKSVSDLLG